MEHVSGFTEQWNRGLQFGLLSPVFFSRNVDLFFQPHASHSFITDTHESSPPVLCPVTTGLALCAGSLLWSGCAM